jgi:hypothetical protein
LDYIFIYFLKKFHPSYKNGEEEQSTEIHTSVNIFEESKRDKSQYFVDKVKDKRWTKKQ